MHQEQTARPIAAKDGGDDHSNSEKILVSGAAWARSRRSDALL